MALDQVDQNLCKTFCPEMFTKGNKTNAELLALQKLLDGKSIDDNFQLYNVIESMILEIELEDDAKKLQKKENLKFELILQKIKILAI